MDHYGNFPTHCPQWAQMDINEKKNTALEAEYCLRCFAPKIYVKTGIDVIKHHEDECYVKGTNKHKFTCLNKSCVKHSWICQDHVDENTLLLAAHYEEFNLQGQQIPAPTSATSSRTTPLKPSRAGLPMPQPRAGFPSIVDVTTTSATSPLSSQLYGLRWDSRERCKMDHNTQLCDQTSPS